MESFQIQSSFLRKKKISPKFQKALAVRLILKSKPEIKINEENINLLMGSNTHLVLYPINKKNEINLTCVFRHNQLNPENIKSLIEKKSDKSKSSFKKSF